MILIFTGVSPNAAFIPEQETFLLGPLLALPETFWLDALQLDPNYLTLKDNMTCFPKSEVL